MPLKRPAFLSPGPLLAFLRRSRRLSIALILLLAALVGWLAWHYWLAPKQERMGPPPLVPIVAEAAVTEDFPVRLTAVGNVVPRNVVTVRSRVDGELDKVLFTEGQAVRAGDLLAVIDPRPFEVALTQSQGQLARDQALLANARADLARYEGLAKLDAIPGQQLDTQKALVQQYEAAVKVDIGALDNARLQLSYTRIASPVAGRVGLRQVDPGNLIHASDANGLVIVTQVQPVTVVFSVSESELPKILTRIGLQTSGAPPRGKGGGAAGDAASPLAVEAWDRDGKVLLAKGQLLTVDNQIDATTGTVKVKALFSNGDGALFPNQFVNVKLVVHEIKDATVIPAAAVQRGEKGSFVWLVSADGKSVSQRPVKLDAGDAERTPVVDGLKPGDRVAVDSFDRLREGAKIVMVSKEARNVAPAAHKPGAAGGRRNGPGGPRP